jgi:hypothetical protein
MIGLVRGSEIDLSKGGAGLIVAKEVDLEQGGVGVALSSGEVELDSGGAGVMVGAKAEVEGGFVGLLLSGKTSVSEGGRILLGTRQAFALGLAFGIGFALVRLLSRAGD